MNTGSRPIRVFLSSTFQDMQSERDYLVKHTFPAIKAIAKLRHVDFSVVDLRWGVTEEEARRGKVIEICFNEIDNTRPFFIGIIGNRYGWCPGAKDIENNVRLHNVYPFVDELIEHGYSVTEMEMRYAAFMDRGSVRSHFYLKDVSKNSNESPELQSKLEQLRTFVEDKAKEGKCQANHYDTPKDLGSKIYKELLSLLNELYPENENNPLDRLIKRQQYLLHQKQEVYYNDYGLKALSDQVDNLEGKRWCIRIYGFGGEGKTALISNFWKDSQYIIRTLLNPEDNTAQIALTHLREEMRIRNLSPNQVLWIIDGLDVLETDYDRSLRWLMIDELHDVNLILTTNDENISSNIEIFAERTKRELDDASAHILFKQNDIIKITLNYLRQFAKGLSSSQLSKIKKCELFANVSILQIFLQEILQYGDYDTLNDFMQPYLEAQSDNEFFNIVLNRLERDYDKETIRKFFGLLRLANYGIPEEDMRCFVKMNAIRWSGFLEAVRPLIWRSYSTLRLTSKSYFSSVIFERYLKNDKDLENQLRHKLIELYERIREEWLNKEYHHHYRSRFYNCILKLPYFTSDTRTLDLVEKDLVHNYCFLKKCENFIQEKSFFQIERIANHSPELYWFFRGYINGSAKQLIRFFPFTVMTSLTKDYIPIICSDYLRGNKEEILYFRKFLKRQFVPIILKRQWMACIDEFLSSKHVPLEQTWAKQSLDDINIGSISVFLQEELPYITSSDRIVQIEKETDILINRFNNDKEQNVAQIYVGERYIESVTMPYLYLIKSYCLVRRKEYGSATKCIDRASQLNPNINRFYTVCYVIYKSIDSSERLNGLIDLNSSEYVLWDNSASSLILDIKYPLELIDAINNRIFAKVDEYEHYIKWLHEDNEFLAYTQRLQTANLLYTTQNYKEALDLYVLAFEVAPEGKKMHCLNAAADCISKREFSTCYLEKLESNVKKYTTEGDIELALCCLVHILYYERMESKRTCNRSTKLRYCNRLVSLFKEVLFIQPADFLSHDFNLNLATMFANRVIDSKLKYPEYITDQVLLDKAIQIIKLAYKKQLYSDIESVYCQTMLVREQYEPIKSLIQNCDEDLQLYYNIVSVSDKKLRYQAQIKATEKFMKKWDKVKSINTSEPLSAEVANIRMCILYSQLWNSMLAPYYMPVMLEIMKDVTHPMRPNATAAMLMHYNITEYPLSMHFCIDVANSVLNDVNISENAKEPLRAIMQCIHAQ